MTNRSERDFWVEMSVREISTQAHFADVSFRHIAGNTDTVFMSIHSFLSHSVMISKMLKSKNSDTTGSVEKLTEITIGSILGVDNSSIIHKRKFRNNLEHYDERLKEWIRKKGVNASIGTYNIGPKSALNIPNMVFVSHFDPDNYHFTFVNRDFDLKMLHKEVIRIGLLADNWITGT